MSNFYRSVNPSFWQGSTGKNLRGNPEVQVLAFYLITNPHTTMHGVYHLPLAYICHDTGLSEKATLKGLARLLQEGFCEYFPEEETIFVYKMLSYQCGNLKNGDNRLKGIINWFNDLPDSVIKQRFASIYSNQYDLKYEGASKPLISPLKAPGVTEAVTEAVTGTEKRSATGVARPESVSKEIWVEFNKICKAKGKPVGELVLKKLVDESQKAGWSLERALTWCCEKGFARFEASWVANEKPKLVVNETFAGSL